MILLDPLARPVIAHRGASGAFPENTILAFRRSIDAGADAIEFDVRLTADGVPVVIHDPTVDRTTNGSGPVGSLTFARLRELDAGHGERVPSLEEVFETFTDVPCIIELKEVTAGRAAAEMLRANPARDRVLLGSFDHGALRPCRAAGLGTSASRRETAWFWLASRVGWPRPSGRYVGFAVPERYGRLQVVDQRFVGLAAATGVPVHVWTVDDVIDAARLRALGVAGIITNFPERMQGLPS